MPPPWPPLSEQTRRRGSPSRGGSGPGAPAPLGRSSPPRAHGGQGTLRARDTSAPATGISGGAEQPGAPGRPRRAAGPVSPGPPVATTLPVPGPAPGAAWKLGQGRSILYLIHPLLLWLGNLWYRAGFKEEPDRAQSHQSAGHSTHGGLCKAPVLQSWTCASRSKHPTFESRGFIYNDTQTGFSKRCLFFLVLSAWDVLHKQKRNILGAASELRYVL